MIRYLGVAKWGLGVIKQLLCKKRAEQSVDLWVGM